MRRGTNSLSTGLALLLAWALGCSAGRESGKDAGGGTNQDESARDAFGNADAGQGRRAPNPDRDGGSGAANAGTSGGGTTPQEPPNRLPTFPGAGTSNAGAALQNGKLCDSVAGDTPVAPEQTARCFADRNDPSAIAATLEQVLECRNGTNTIHVRLTLHPWFVDNTYGLGSIGWPPVRGHWFFDLLVSDHAELIVQDGAGKEALRFKLDYLSEDPSSPSGYGALGTQGGEGEMITGEASAVVAWSTSLHRNLNERGYGQYTVDSPVTDADFEPNPATPEWDYRVVYEAWIDADVFGSAGFGGATIEYVHASPSKSDTETIEVEPGKCKCADEDPDADCGDTPPPPPGCVDNDPDTFCGEAGAGGGPSAGSGGSGGEPFCKENTDDPACRVD